MFSCLDVLEIQIPHTFRGFVPKIQGIKSDSQFATSSWAKWARKEYGANSRKLAVSKL